VTDGRGLGNAAASFAASSQASHRRGHATFVRENQPLRRGCTDLREILFALPEVGFGVARDGMERLFSPQAMPPDQILDLLIAQRDARLTEQSRVHFGQRQTGLRWEPSPHLLLCLFAGAQLAARTVRHAFGLPGVLALRWNLPRPSLADAGPRRQLGQGFLAAIVGAEHYAAQIIEIAASHYLVCGV